MLRAKVQRNCVELSSVADVGVGRVSTLRKHREVIHRERMEIYFDGRAVSLPLQSKPVVRFECHSAFPV